MIRFFTNTVVSVKMRYMLYTKVSKLISQIIYKITELKKITH